MESHEQQKNLVREQFTRTAEVFGDYAVASRVGEAALLARLVFTNTTLFAACEKP